MAADPSRPAGSGRAMSDAATSEADRQRSERMFGIAAALGSFVIWGVAPIYFKAVAEAGALEVLAHRVVWTVVLLAGLVAIIGRWDLLIATIGGWRRLWIYGLTTALISVNWLVFIWAVTNDHLLQASLGYFINPLVNVLLGLLFLGERLNRAQSVAVLLAMIGVGNLVIGYGELPWVSLVLAFSFGFYALLRKRFRIDPLIGLLVETMLLLPLGLAYLLWLTGTGSGQFWTGGWTISLLLVAGGAVTATPLILFMYGAQRLTLSAIGVMQYLAPSMHFLLAVLVYAEPFTSAHLVTFAAIWLGLVVFTGDAVRRNRPRAAVRAEAAP